VQKPNGGAVWEDLVLRDARKRRQLGEEQMAGGDEMKKPIKIN
jgi:hypothetical protein